MGSGQDVILAGQPPGPVITALAALALAPLDLLAPGDAGAHVLQSLGLAGRAGHPGHR